MNKEQMLQSLKELEYNINNGLVNDEELKAKMDDLNIELNLLEDEIYDLSNKIEDDTNYPTFFALYDEAEISNAKRELNIAKTGLESTKLTIAQVEEYISHIKKEIEENNFKMQELNNENLAQGARLRELGIAPNVEEEELIREVLNMNRNEITKINAKNDRAREILQENEAQLVALLESKSSFENKVNNAQINLNNAESNQASRPLVNEAARNIDKNELESKKIIKKSFEKQKTALSINLSDEVNKIINDLQNDVITVEQVSDRLNELKNNVSTDYFNADRQDRNNELVQNRKVQVELEEKINNLTAKVNNIDNYKYSDLELAREDEKVKVLATKVQNSNSRIAELEKSKQQVENDLAIQNKKVESREVENRIIALKAQLRKAKNENDKNQIKLELDAAQKEAWNDLNDLTDVKAELENINVSLATEKNNLERYTKLHENAILRKDTIDKKVKNNEVQNAYQRRLDEMELSKSKAALESLNNRAKFISLPILDQLNNIIDGNVKGEEETFENANINLNNEEAVFEGKNGEEIKVDVPLPFDENLGVKDASFDSDEKSNQIFMDNGINNDVEQKILDTLNNNEKLNGLKFTFNHDNENAMNNEPLNDANVNDANLEEPQMEEEKEEEKVVPLVGKMKAKFKTASDKLKAKAKDLEFRSKLKKWAKVIAVIAASAMLLVASGKLPQKTIDQLQDPKVIEQIDNEELDPNEIIKEETEEEPVLENNNENIQENNNQNIENNIENNQPKENNNINNSENKNNGNNNSSNNNNSGNNNNFGNNNNSGNNGSKPNDHDNSDEITVPEDNNEQNQDDITIEDDTPVEEIVPEATIEDEKEEDAIIEDEKEEIFDNEEEIEEGTIEEGNDDIIIEDWEEENQTGEEEIFDNEEEFGNIEDNSGNENEEEVFDNEEEFGNIEDNNGNENQEEVFDNEEEFGNIEDNSGNENQENVYDNEEEFGNTENNNGNENQEEVFDNQENVENNDSNNNSEEENVYDNSEDVQNNTTGVEVLEGETYLNDNMEEVYTNGGDIDSALDKDSSIHSIDQNVEEGKDVINVYTNEDSINQQTQEAPVIEEQAPVVEEAPAPVVEEQAPAVEQPAVELGNETEAQQISYNSSYEELSELDKLKLQREYYANMQNVETDSLENVSKSL